MGYVITAHFRSKMRRLGMTVNVLKYSMKITSATKTKHQDFSFIIKSTKSQKARSERFHAVYILLLLCDCKTHLFNYSPANDAAIEERTKNYFVTDRVCKVFFSYEATEDFL
jgi:hypothetical protein